MAKHTVHFNLNQIELGNGDFTFELRRDKGMFGRLTVSKRAIKYYPKNGKKPSKTFTWKGFDKAMRNAKNG